MGFHWGFGDFYGMKHGISWDIIRNLDELTSAGQGLSPRPWDSCTMFSARIMYKLGYGGSYEHGYITTSNMHLILGTAPPSRDSTRMCSELFVTSTSSMVFEPMNFGTSTVLGLFWDFNSFKKMGTEFMKSLGFVNFHQQCEFERATC